MATLLTCQSVSKHFGTRRLFEGLSISFADKERVGFLGPNGAGKTTFLRILAGEITPDDGGDIERRRNATICFVPQEESFPNDATVDSVLTDAIADQPLEPYQRDARISIITSQFGFEQTDQPVDHLSGGWRKRLALARAFVQEPDLLLMDEPTNHLDLSGITWLEDTLLNTPFAFLVVSHDRYFLERVTNRVVELNRIYPDGYFSVSGNYSKFLEKRADFLAAQQTQEETLKNLVRREVTFLRSHAKARRSKSKSRIDDAYRIQDELKTIKDRTSGATSARIDFEGTGRRSKKLLEAKNLAKTLGQKLLFENVSVFLSPGTRLGLLGANGSGKTTLIRLLVGALPPDQGTVQPADDVRIVVFDQKREALPQDLTLKQALAGRDDSVDFRGQSIHITSWAKRFLFRTDQLDMPVGELSGGEQARILIARLMRQPADILILDEPTNDLDIASLDVLETSLTEFPGAIVLVTHDRHMLDRVCTEILGISGHGPVGRYTSCAHWQTTQQEKSKSVVTEGPKEKAAKKQKRQRKRLSASETKDLQLMEQTIQDAEQRVDVCRQAVEDPAIATDHVEVQKRWDAMEAAKKEVEALYTRWQELEAKLAALEEDDG